MNLDAKSFLLPTTTTTYIPKGAMLHTFTDIEKGIRYLLVVICICIVLYICNRKLFYGLENKVLFWRASWWFDNYIDDFKIKMPGLHKITNK